MARKPERHTRTISILVTPTMYETLKAIARANNRSLAGELRALMEWHIERSGR